MGRGKGRLNERYMALIDGRLSVDDLDDEEIIRGRLRGKHGTFSGGSPKVIPFSMHAALQRAMSQRMERRMIEAIPDVIDSLVKIATAGPGVDAKARVQAATFLVERAIGKAPDVVAIESTVTHRWEEAAQSGRLFVDVDPEDTTVSGAVQAEPTPELTVGYEDEDIVDAVVIEPEHEFIPEPVVEEPGSTAVTIETKPPKRRPRPLKPRPTGVTASNGRRSTGLVL